MSPTTTPQRPQPRFLSFGRPPPAFHEHYASSNSREPIPEYPSQGSPVPPVQALTERTGFTAQDVLEGMVSSCSGHSARDANRIGHLPGLRQKNPINPFTQQPRSDAYHDLLQKRTQLPVFAQLEKFCKMVSRKSAQSISFLLHPRSR